MLSLPKLAHHEVTISPSTVIFAVGLLLGLYFLYYIRVILVLLFLAFIIMTALHPGVEKLTNKVKLPRILSIVIMYSLLIAGVVSLFAFLVPPLVGQLYLLIKAFDLPVLQDEIRNLRFTFSELSTLVNQVGNQAGLIFSLLTSTFEGIFTLFTLVVMSFYMMMDRPNLHLKVGWLTHNPKHIQQAKDFLDSIESQLGGWIRGQVILMLSIGMISYLGLVLFAIPYALPLALLAGMLEILPNIGPTVAAIPAIILGFWTHGPVVGGMMVLFYVVVQQVENNVLVPKIMQSNADVNPLVAIVVILIGLEMGGVIGALLSVPAYIVVRTIYSWLHRGHFRR